MRGEKGYCGLGDEAYVFRDFLHFGEEPELIPSHTVYLTGCNFRCVYCSNRRHVDDARAGTPLDCSKVARNIDISFSAGGRNANFLGGEPTVNLLAILKIMENVEGDLPVVWNSNMYMTEPAMELVASFAEYFLADFKYGNDLCAQKLSGADEYLRHVKRNLLSASKTGTVIIRHLPLAGHLDCCSRNLIRWISENLPDAKVHLLKNFIPFTEVPGISGSDYAELAEIESFMDSLGIRRTAEIGIGERMEHLKKMDIRPSLLHETNIVIDKDGTLSIQDLDGGLARLARRMSD